MENNIQYFIFGRYASRVYQEGEWDTLAELRYKLSADEYSVFEFDPELHDVFHVLHNYSGWNGYAEISKEVYEYLGNPQL